MPCAMAITVPSISSTPPSERDFTIRTMLVTSWCPVSHLPFTEDEVASHLSKVNTYDLSGIYEDEGPMSNFCPERILDLLSSTDSQLALDWRERCQERLQVEMGQTASRSPLPAAKADLSDRFILKGFPMPENNGLDGMDDFNRGHDWNKAPRLKNAVRPDHSVDEPSAPRPMLHCRPAR